jgi:hypothetical protein
MKTKIFVITKGLVTGPGVEDFIKGEPIAAAKTYTRAEKIVDDLLDLEPKRSNVAYWIQMVYLT